MGKILQIRVSAWTYREEDVTSTWPNLAELVWKHAPYSGEVRGVLEFVTALQNELSFGEWPKETVSALQEGIAGVVAYKEQLEAALSDWQPREANRLSDVLEDALSELDWRVR